MATTTAPHARSGSKPAATLTLSDILSDLDKMPTVSSSAQDSLQASSSTSLGEYTLPPLPESSKTVATSMELSQRFIESSRRVLQDTDALDAAKARLDRVESALEEVEESVHA